MPIKEIAETRNSKLLKEFTEYCERNPEQRFWQALRNYAEVPYIMVGNIVDTEDPISCLFDTFYWNGKNE